ncbi:hypothetical protein Gotur_019595 [Gossypium turneri]
MRGTYMLIWILIICLSQVAVQSEYYSKSLPYHPKPVKVTNLHFFLHESLGSENPTAVSEYYSKSLPYHPKPVKVTNLHFFLHKTIGSETPTAVVIAQANIPSNDNNSSVPFATLYALDDPLKRRNSLMLKTE